MNYLEYSTDYIEVLKRSSSDFVSSNIKDMVMLLEANDRNLSTLQSQSSFSRVWNNLTGKNANLKSINSTNLLQVQKLSLSVITELEKQNMITREVQLMLFDKLNELAISHVELKEFIVIALNKIADRFENVESNLDFTMLLQEVKEGIYNVNSKIGTVLMIYSKISTLDINNERNMNLLDMVLKNREVLTMESKKLSDYLLELSLEKEDVIKELNSFIIDYVDHPLMYAIEKVFEFCLMDKSKKKFLKFKKIINNISEEINTDISLEDIEIRDIILDCIIEKNNKCLESINIVEEEVAILEEEIVYQFYNLNTAIFGDIELNNKEINIDNETRIQGNIVFNKCKIIFKSRLNARSDKIEFNECDIYFNQKEVEKTNSTSGFFLFGGGKTECVNNPLLTWSPILDETFISFNNCNIQMLNYENYKLGDIFNHSIECNMINSHILFNGCKITNMSELIKASVDNYDLVFRNCIIENCKNLIKSNTILIENCKFNENSGFIFYGAVYDIKIQNSEFKNHILEKHTYNYTSIICGEIIENVGNYLFESSNLFNITIKNSMFSNIPISIINKPNNIYVKKYIDNCELIDCLNSNISI